MSDVERDLAGALAKAAGPRELRLRGKQVLESLQGALLPDHGWHPYGFLVLRFGEVLPGRPLRIHIWPPTPRIRQSPDWPIHNHPWPLTSAVLAGRLRQQRFRVHANPQGSARLFSVEYGEAESILKPTETRVDYSLIADDIFRPGDTYTVQPDVYHQVDVDPGLVAVTAVLAGPTNGARAHIVGRLDDTSEYSFRRRRVTIPELEGVIAVAVATM